jgi:hypothetical protein
VEGSRQLFDASRDGRLSPATSRISSTMPAISSLHACSNIDKKRKRVPQSSTTTQSRLLSQLTHAQAFSSIQASVDRTLGCFTNAVDSNLSGSGRSADPLHTHLSQAIPAKAETSATFIYPLDSVSNHACEEPGLEVIRTHNLSEKRSTSPSEITRRSHTSFICIIYTRLIVHLQLQHRQRYLQHRRLQLPRHYVVDLNNYCRLINV